MRRSARDEFLSPSKGFAGFMHRLVMFILLPLRKPLIVFPVLFLLYLIPTFIGAKPTEVHLWYMKEFRKAYASAAALAADKFGYLFAGEAKTEQAQPEDKQKPKGIDILVEPHQKAVRRQMFEKAKAAPVAVNILEIHNEDVVNVEDVRRAEKEARSVIENYNNQLNQMRAADEKSKDAGADTPVFKVSTKLPLIYLKEPKPVEGEAEVKNANELVVGGTYIFLYGIYVDPNLARGAAAKKFLVDKLKGKKVRCNIVAYTYQDVATGLCYVDGENINQLLVDEDYSRNVAL